MKCNKIVTSITMYTRFLDLIIYVTRRTYNTECYTEQRICFKSTGTVICFNRLVQPLCMFSFSRGSQFNFYFLHVPNSLTS